MNTRKFVNYVWVGMGEVGIVFSTVTLTICGGEEGIVGSTYVSLVYCRLLTLM